jgi:hypothetical protein
MISCPVLSSSPSSALLIIRPHLPPLLIECVVVAMEMAHFVFLIFLVRPLLRERGFLFRFLGLALSKYWCIIKPKQNQMKYEGRSQLLLR